MSVSFLNTFYSNVILPFQRFIVDRYLKSIMVSALELLMYLTWAKQIISVMLASLSPAMPESKPSLAWKTGSGSRYQNALVILKFSRFCFKYSMYVYP